MCRSSPAGQTAVRSTVSRDTEGGTLGEGEGPAGLTWGRGRDAVTSQVSVESQRGVSPAGAREGPSEAAEVWEGRCRPAAGARWGWTPVPSAPRAARRRATDEATEEAKINGILIFGAFYRFKVTLLA